MQLSPFPELKPFVRHFLWLDNSITLYQRLTMFNDGNPGLVFCFSGRVYVDPLFLQPYPLVFFYGQPEKFKNFYLQKNSKLLVVVFQPFALCVLSKSSASVITDQIIPAEDLLKGMNLENFIERFQYHNLYDCIAIISKLIKTWFDREMNNDEQLLFATLNYIKLKNGDVTSSQLANFTGYGERFIEKKFKQYVASSPKRIANTFRLLQFMKSLKTSNDEYSLTQQALHFGFYDQSHLNHSFKALTGTNPTFYKQRNHPLALNLVATINY